MADDRKPGDAPEQEKPEAPEPDAAAQPAVPFMSEAQIRAAGMSIDLPFEAPAGRPGRLRYADLGPGKRYGGEGAGSVEKASELQPDEEKPDAGPEKAATDETVDAPEPKGPKGGST